MYYLRRRYQIDNYIKGDKMRQSHKFLATIDSSFYRRYLQQMLMIVGFILFSLGSSSAFAADNPGATCSGIAGASQERFADSDYTNLATAVNTSDYIDIAGNASGSIPLQIKMTITEQNGPPSSNSSFSATTVANTRVFNIFRNFPSMLSVTSVDFDFRNKITEQPIFLTNVALSAFDIDYANSSGNIFDDYVLFTGVTKSGETIDGTYRAVTRSRIRPYSDSRPNTPGTGLYTLGNTANCPISDLDTVCQGSVQFSEPVQSVKVRYSNANFRIFGDPTNQEIHLRIDNYCYVPQYVFSGTVFNDNGGIPSNRADKDNADITSPGSVYANRPNYFNGIFDTAQELGISLGIDGSTVKLANCANTSTTYTTQSVIKDGAPVGKYMISIPKTSLPTNTNLCLVESRSGNTYPIRTNSESRNIRFSNTTYNYPDNNFGRVIAANAALVLRKAQYVNDCPATLDYSADSLNTPDNTNPRNGFSEDGINGSNLIPGQCIAYRITATNRANLPINDFVMQDTLQKKGIKSALITSELIGPIHNADDYATNSIDIGENGTVITRKLSLDPRKSRNFYFNTKYGTTNGNSP